MNHRILIGAVALVLFGATSAEAAGERLPSDPGKAWPSPRISSGAVAQGSAQSDASKYSSAEELSPSAQLTLGIAYAVGDGVERDEALAIEWLTRAAEAGNTTALYNLGLLNVALGDFSEAYLWFAIASERSAGNARSKAVQSRRMMALATPIEAVDMASRDAADWMEEFDPVPAANLAADRKLEFIALPTPSNDPMHGWRQKAAEFQRAARESLQMHN